MSSIDYNLEVQSIDGSQGDLTPYADKVLLVVNTASACGFTPQFQGLEKLHQDYGDKGLAVLGFPCNQFGSQDSGSNEDIAQFCQKNYGVTFPMHAKVEVNGNNAHPLFATLKKAQKGVLGTEAIKWNFTKFLVGKNGEVLARYAPKATPEDLRKDIETALQG